VPESERWRLPHLYLIDEDQPVRRTLLGPVREPGERPPGRVLGEFALVLAGLAAGARYVLRRRGPAAALGATGGNRFLYGILFLMSILLYRNYFYRSAGANTALSHYTVLVVASALGYACAALITKSARLPNSSARAPTATATGSR